MKYLHLLLVLLLSSFLASCSSSDEENSDKSNEDLEIIKVDLSEAREGKLSEFFEPKIEYIWLKDVSEDAQLGGLNKVFFHEEKIFTLDIFGCKCIKIFDHSGKYLSKIWAYGEGPEKYLDFDDAIIVKDEVLILGVYPPKLMWFSLDGEFIKEEKLKEHIESGVYSDLEKRYYFYANPREIGKYFISSVDTDFKDTLMAFPFELKAYYGNYSGRNTYKKSENSIYSGMSFNDTIYQVKSGEFIPKLAFDFGEYAQSIDELKNIEESSTALEELDFINKRSKLYFVPHQWFITESKLYSGFNYQEDFYNVFYDRESQQTRIIKGRISDDLDEVFDPYSILHQFNDAKVGVTIPGKTLFKTLQKKKAELGQEGFEEYVKGKGKSFAQAAFAAKDSENPVLIVYTVKK